MHGCQCNADNNVAYTLQRRSVEYDLIPFCPCVPCNPVGDRYYNLLTYETADVEKQHDAQDDTNPVNGIDTVAVYSNPVKQWSVCVSHIMFV